jgi:myo-inositol-1(or 4)-monophosphatase
MSGDARRLARLAERAAARAADHLRRSASPEPAAWQAKGHQDFVTEVDRVAEALITDTLLRAEPAGRVMGEEASPQLASLRGLVWVVDPLDGTTNFLHGYPVWAVSIGAAVDGELIAGTVFEVPTGRRATAWRGGGAWCNGVPLGVSTIDHPGRSLIGTGFPFKHPDLLDAYLRQLGAVLGATSGVRRGGAAAVDLLDVASGHLDGFWELRLAPWDTAAGIVLVREAGGVVARLDGRPIGVEHSGVVAGNEAIVAWLLATIDERR